MKATILGVSFDNLSPEKAAVKAFSFLNGNSVHVVFTPNPEMVMLAQKDAEFAATLSSAELVIPDGIGIVWASQLTKPKIKKRVPGIELMTDLLERVAKSGHGVYFLGAAPDVAEAAAEKVVEKHPALNICGFYHGYFKDNEDAVIIDKINASGADIVFVGLGFPRQEKWIMKHRDKINAKILMGVGGSFDVLSGRLRRAPKFFQKIGMEWLYRLLRQPSRILRQTVLLKFVLLVIYKKIRGEL
ncbi:MAG: WecB/TagA/CpsF family glycosyltransferase [Defluviitaleaceae bacterium]|nr:WecB/TagA/CpsF family glycosyltransferase [Defluviitaleaceae bacterium]